MPRKQIVGMFLKQFVQNSILKWGHYDIMVKNYAKPKGF